MQRRVKLYNATEGNLPGINCSKCRNKGKIASLNADGIEVMKECGCIKARAVNDRAAEYMAAYGIDMKSTTFDQYETPEEWQKTAKMSAKCFADQFGNFDKNWLYIGGQNGAGKTHLCTTVCTELVRKQYAVHYESWKSLVQKLEALRFDEGYEDLIIKVQNAEVLFIDDLLKQKDKSKLPNELNLAFEILDVRSRSKKATIISSEWLIDDLFKLDAGLAGRIRQMAYLIQIAYNEGRDWRARV